MPAKKLPLNISDFKSLIEGGFIYVDKTREIFNLLKNPKICYLQRPPGSGTSLLLSTIAEIFSGRRSLFEGLWISRSNYSWTPCQVFRFECLEFDFRYSFDLPINLAAELQLSAETSRNLESIDETEAWNLIPELLEELSKIYGGRLVFLVDNYDAPLRASLSDSTLSRKRLESLIKLGEVLCENSRFIHFAVLASQINLFSPESKNSPLKKHDLSRSKSFNSLCGFSPAETSANFRPQMEGIIRDWQALGLVPKNYTAQNLLDLMTAYYGSSYYRQDESVFEPAGILGFLAEGTFEDCLFNTPQTAYLIDLALANSMPQSLVTASPLPPASEPVRPVSYSERTGKKVFLLSETAMPGSPVKDMQLKRIMRFILSGMELSRKTEHLVPIIALMKCLETASLDELTCCIEQCHKAVKAFFPQKMPVPSTLFWRCLFSSLEDWVTFIEDIDSITVMAGLNIEDRYQYVFVMRGCYQTDLKGGIEKLNFRLADKEVAYLMSLLTSAYENDYRSRREQPPFLIASLSDNINTHFLIRKAPPKNETDSLDEA
ncbi:MAG: AAA family ATPase [Deltaproteobacteria bacterium]|jgi:hypothetical protein|nr:AAA family ATPase [Deltaproteobacteria bacterium]